MTNLEFVSLSQSSVYYTSADKQFRKCFDFVWFLGGVYMFTSLLHGFWHSNHLPQSRDMFIRLIGDSKISHCPCSLITFAFKTKSINKVFLIYLKTFKITYSAILRFSLSAHVTALCVYLQVQYGHFYCMVLLWCLRVGEHVNEILPEELS